MVARRRCTWRRHRRGQAKGASGAGHWTWRPLSGGVWCMTHTHTHTHGPCLQMEEVTWLGTTQPADESPPRALRSERSLSAVHTRRVRACTRHTPPATHDGAGASVKPSLEPGSSLSTAYRELVLREVSAVGALPFEARGPTRHLGRRRCLSLRQLPRLRGPSVPPAPPIHNVVRSQRR